MGKKIQTILMSDNKTERIFLNVSEICTVQCKTKVVPKFLVSFMERNLVKELVERNKTLCYFLVGVSVKP